MRKESKILCAQEKKHNKKHKIFFSKDHNNNKQENTHIVGREENLLRSTCGRRRKQVEPNTF